MQGSYSNCNCLPDPIQSDSWNCIDGSSSRWQIQGKELNQLVTGKIDGYKILQHSVSSTGITWYIASDDDGKKSIWKAVRSSGAATRLRSTDDTQLAASANGYWTWSDGKDTTIEYWVDARYLRTDTLPGPIKRAQHFPDEALLMVQFEKGSYTGWRLVSPIQSQSVHLTKWIGAELYPLCRRYMLVEDDGLFSVKDSEETRLGWSVTAPNILSTTNFSVSASGRHILLGNSIIDLKEIAQINIDKYRAAQLLQDSSLLSWVELVEDRDIQTGKSRFNLIRLSGTGLDTNWGKTWFSPEMDGKSYLD
jgi:hypothetical protein